MFVDSHCHLNFPGLRERIVVYEQRIAELEAKVAWLMDRVARLEAENSEVVRLRAENQDLRAQLARNSQNSSKPPSSDPPGVERPGKEPTGRRPGSACARSSPPARPVTTAMPTWHSQSWVASSTGPWMSGWPPYR